MAKRIPREKFPSASAEKGAYFPIPAIHALDTMWLISLYTLSG